MCNCPFRYHFSLSDRADSNRLLCLKFNQSNPRRKQLSALIKTNPTQSSAETNLLCIYLTVQPRSRPKATCCWISLLPKSITLATESNLLMSIHTSLQYQKIHSLFIHNSGNERLGAMIPEVSTPSGAVPGVSRWRSIPYDYTCTYHVIHTFTCITHARPKTTTCC